nr:MAG TPA: hypothetical protein [Caudoviricetes sp.]
MIKYSSIYVSIVLYLYSENLCTCIVKTFLL